MLIEIDPLASTPIYEQIRDLIVEAIASGHLKTGDPLNSTRGMAMQFGINVATVSKAYDQLRTEGLVLTNRKSGTLVARDPDSGPPDSRFIEGWMPRLRALLAEATAQGLNPEQIITRSNDLLAGLGISSPSASRPSPTSSTTPPTSTRISIRDERHDHS